MVESVRHLRSLHGCPAVADPAVRRFAQTEVRLEILANSLYMTAHRVAEVDAARESIVGVLVRRAAESPKWILPEK